MSTGARERIASQEAVAFEPPRPSLWAPVMCRSRFLAWSPIQASNRIRNDQSKPPRGLHPRDYGKIYPIARNSSTAPPGD